MINSKSAMIEREVNCPKCRGTEYCSYHVVMDLHDYDAYYYHCEDCHFTSEPQ